MKNIFEELKEKVKKVLWGIYDLGVIIVKKIFWVVFFLVLFYLFFFVLN